MKSYCNKICDTDVPISGWLQQECENLLCCDCKGDVKKLNLLIMMIAIMTCTKTMLSDDCGGCNYDVKNMNIF